MSWTGNIQQRVLPERRSRSSETILKMHYEHTLQTGARLEGEPDLRDLADFSTCAVVGSSGSLKGSGQGAEIDSHTAVIRFNEAPSKGHQVLLGADRPSPGE